MWRFRIAYLNFIWSITTPLTEKRMTRFRPCIDLHAGSVKQIVGGTLSTDDAALKTNFTSEHPSAFYAELYRKHDLRGGHVIMLGFGNDEAAREALRAWPEGLQVGGGIKDSNAKTWVDAGAERVCYRSGRNE
jgi:phosphoribosylformimino-5-aminoimidazole carboxamide ribotide isomerase